jgi:hypothetical protein
MLASASSLSLWSSSRAQIHSDLTSGRGSIPRPLNYVELPGVCARGDLRRSQDGQSRGAPAHCRPPDPHRGWVRKSRLKIFDARGAQHTVGGNSSMRSNRAEKAVTGSSPDRRPTALDISARSSRFSTGPVRRLCRGSPGGGRTYQSGAWLSVSVCRRPTAPSLRACPYSYLSSPKRHTSLLRSFSLTSGKAQYRLSSPPKYCLTPPSPRLRWLPLAAL